MNDTTKLPGHTAAHEQSKIDQALQKAAAPDVPAPNPLAGLEARLQSLNTRLKTLEQAPPPAVPVVMSLRDFEARLKKVEHEIARFKPVFDKYFGHEA